MAYGFNDDKSKAEISGIKILEHTFTDVLPYTSSGYAFTKSVLANLGIDITEYMVIGVSQQVDEQNVYFNNYYVPESTSDGSEHHYLTRPCAIRNNQNGLNLVVYNSTDENADIVGQVMLMKIM